MNETRHHNGGEWPFRVALTPATVRIQYRSFRIVWGFQWLREEACVPSKSPPAAIIEV
jgi:hypothetical protein